MKKIYKYIPLLLSIILSTAVLILSMENIGRSVTVIFFIWAWYFLSKYLRNYFLSSVIILLFVFPFNITINLSGLYEPYVNGIIINYLIPHISIIDMFSCVLIFSYIFEYGIPKIRPTVTLLITLFALSLLFHLNIISLISTVRLVLYVFTVVCIYQKVNEIKKISDKIVYSLLISISIQLIISIIQLITSADLGLQFLGESNIYAGNINSSFLNISGRELLRAYGTFPHPNIFAGYLLFSISLFLLLKKRHVSYIGIVLSFISLILTFSRVHILLGVGLLPFLFYRGGIYSFLPIAERFSSLFINDTSLNERTKLVDMAFSRIRANPLGIGNSLYVKYFENYEIRTNSGLQLLQPVHNIFLLLLSEHGWIFGTGIALTILYLLIKKYLKRNIFYIYLLISIIVIGIFEHYFLTLPQGLFLFLLALL